MAFFSSSAYMSMHSEDDDDKYDKAYWDPFWCSSCDLLFTNTAKFKMHKMMHRGMRISLRAYSHGSYDSALHSDDYDEYSENDEEDYDLVTGKPLASALVSKPVDRMYTCDKCRILNFVDPGEYWYHMTESHRECLECKEIFKSELQMEDHFQKSPTCLSWPACQINEVCEDDCDWVQATQYPDDSAGAVDAFTTRCPLCDEPELDAEDLNEHLTYNHMKCLRCKLQFGSQEELQKHFSTSTLHRYCKSCEWDFVFSAVLQAHRENHHPSTSGKKKKKQKDRNKKGKDVDHEEIFYDCEYCKKSILEDHIEFHVQHEHIRCFPCKRNFSTQKDLTLHLQNHSKHNFCLQCDTDFLSADALKRHTSTCPKTHQAGTTVGKVLDESNLIKEIVEHASSATKVIEEPEPNVTKELEEHESSGAKENGKKKSNGPKEIEKPGSVDMKKFETPAVPEDRNEESLADEYSSEWETVDEDEKDYSDYFLGVN